MGRFETLVRIMDDLRDPERGCPWDAEQDFSTLRGYLLEECYETLEAIDRDDREALREELGDLLFQVVFLSRLAKEEGAFTAADVVRGIAEKMVRRHPHVFGSARADTADEVLKNWDEIKRRERHENSGGAPRPSALDGVPLALPALARAQQLGQRAARVGFDWPDLAGVVDKLREEAGELHAALHARRQEQNDAALRDELGDVLFTLAMAARHAGIDAEQALAGANRKFESRFRRVEDELGERGLTPGEVDMETLEASWERAKRT